MAASASAGSRHFKIFAAADGFGEPLKDAVVAHLRAHPSVADVVDLGVDKYYAAAAAVARGVSSSAPDPALESRGVVVCGTGAGVTIFANKYPGVYATHCSSAADAVHPLHQRLQRPRPLRHGHPARGRVRHRRRLARHPLPRPLPRVRRRPLAGGHSEVPRCCPR
ncbi:hypothetical protein VPH35_016572 [Triticum aestivum]